MSREGSQTGLRVFLFVQSQNYGQITDLSDIRELECVPIGFSLGSFTAGLD